MGVYKIQDAVRHPEGMCKHCSNIIGPVEIFGNDPNKHEGKGISLKPQWGGRLKDDDSMTQHAFIDFTYYIRDHTDPEHAKKFVLEVKRMDVPLCELGKQLPFVHVQRQKITDYPEIREKLDMEGHPRLLDVDGFKYCGHCSSHQTYQAYADGSWNSTLEKCTNPECIMNGGPIGE